MKTHDEYIKFRLDQMMDSPTRLSEYGEFIFKLNTVWEWDDCELCGAHDWHIARTLVSFPHSKTQAMRMVCVGCKNCGNAKMVSWRIVMQNEKIRLIEAMRNQEETIMGMFRRWEKEHAEPPLPAIMDENYPVEPHHAD